MADLPKDDNWLKVLMAENFKFQLDDTDFQISAPGKKFKSC